MRDASGITQLVDKTFDHAFVQCHVTIQEFKNNFLTDDSIFNEDNSAKTAFPHTADDPITRRQQITFRLTYTSAAIGAFGLAVVLGLAYLIGNRMTKGPSIASSPLARAATSSRICA